MNNKIEIPREVFENIFFSEGGTKRELAKELAGNYQAPLTKDRLYLANAEVEKNEYVFDSNGIRKFGGNTHEKGGTPVKLEEGARILSDHLKIGADLAKQLTKSLKLPFRATDTYAKALDRFNNASDLPKLNKEIENLILKMDSEKSKDKTTFAINNQFLNNTLNSKNKQKQPLEKEMAGFFEMLFEEQEMSKKEQSGSKMQMGGSYLETASRYGIDPKRAKELLSSLPHYQDAEAKYTEEDRRKRFKDFVSSAEGAGYEGDVNPNAKDLGKEAGKLQAWMVKNRPEEVIKYFTESGQPLTAKHVDMLKKNAPWVFENTGISPEKDSASYTKEEKDKLKQSYPLGQTGEPDGAIKKEDYNNFLLEGFHDDKWDWRFPRLAVGAPKVVGYTEPKIAKAEGLKLPNVTNQTLPEEETPEQPNVAAAPGEKNRRGLLLLPDQSPMLPNLLPSLKVQRRFSRIGYNDISPEQQLTEMNRSAAASRQSLQELTPQQRAAAEIGLTANENMMSNKAIADVNRANSAARNAVDIYNAKVSDAEENASAGDALSYEQRTQTALGNYDKEIQGYYDKLASNQMNNYKHVEALNRYNALNPDVQFTGEGYEVNRNPALTSNEQKFLTDLYESDKSGRKQTKKRTATGKFGGRFKK
jgi:hypothetical protein